MCISIAGSQLSSSFLQEVKVTDLPKTLNPHLCSDLSFSPWSHVWSQYQCLTASVSPPQIGPLVTYPSCSGFRGDPEPHPPPPNHSHLSHVQLQTFHAPSLSFMTLEGLIVTMVKITQGHSLRGFVLLAGVWTSKGVWRGKPGWSVCTPAEAFIWSGKSLLADWRWREKRRSFRLTFE